MTEHETRTCEYCGAEMEFHGPPINSYACPENVECNWMRAADLEESSSGVAESYTAPEWRPMPPEKGIYVLSRPHNEYLVTVSIQHVDNVEDRDGWLYYGPIPQPEAESAV